ncbi:MerR family transcriptional regulator [Tolypothrix sp. NIES-4075]|uniref:MerR family DNA-binding transcriptional regulator n=1 Tax=Tolypothrix sp. NIES-4075 TaxID=2005459 RepID=UPI000B5CDA4E|nr:MerR family DNA-binding transcriptional regulator [Tolypothrix sp. NIES-4075]GAX40776.1 MerR family transcriptional regulator [Tolypothrix sp. NIES-4075]
METELTIQQVATLTGLSVHTLRYYERNGLLELVNRAANGHRRYLTDDITRIEFLTRLRTTKMPIRLPCTGGLYYINRIALSFLG